MLTILKTHDASDIENYCKISGVKYCEAVRAFEAKLKDKLCGFVLYRLHDGACEILSVECYADAPLFDGLIRSVFFSVTECGADLPARFDNSIDKALLKKYNFISDDTYSVKSMLDFLNNCKNCKNSHDN